MAIYRKNKTKKFKKLSIALIILVGAVSYAIFHITNFVNPVINTITQEEIKGLSTLSLNQAVSDSMSDTYSYDNLISITYDEDDNVKLITANTVFINVLARTVTMMAQENLSEIGTQRIEIPFGSLSGLSFLSGLGPTFNINVYPVGSVYTEMHSTFYSAGINQTLHQLTVNVVADINIILPGIDSSVMIEVPIVIAENVIAGEIPSTYVNSDDDNMLDLIP